MLLGILMGQNGRPFRIQPCIAVRVIEMPMRVDQMCDRITAKAVDGLEDSRAGCGDSSIDKYLAVGASQNTYVAARALKDADVATQLVDLDGGLGGVIT